MKVQSKSDQTKCTRPNKSTFLATVVNLLKSAVCTGIVVMPALCYQGGYLAVTVQLILMDLLTAYLVYLQSKVTVDYYKTIQLDLSIDELQADQNT